MNGVHDMGGMHGFGPVVPEPNEPTFHADWERRVFGLSLAMGAWGRWNLDMSRHSRERIPPAKYLASTYYELWLYGLERLLVRHELVVAEDMARVRSAPASVSPPPAAVAVQPGALRREGVAATLRRRRAARLDVPAEPRFRVGQHVVARNFHPTGHTRLPRYVRGRRGRVDRDHGVFIFPDTHAVDGTTTPQHVYSVRFAAAELWGPDASASDSVYVDLWDDYLDPA